MKGECTGQHRVYVPEVVGDERTGKIVVITVCTNCDTVNFHEYQMAEGATTLRLLKEEKKERTQNNAV